MADKIFPDYRFGFMITGVLFFVWLPFDDATPLPAMLLGGAFAALLAVRWLSDKAQNDRQPFRRLWRAGLVAGGLTLPITWGLMILKISAHGHVPVENAPGQFAAVASVTPLLVAGGGLIAAGLSAFERNKFAGGRDDAGCQ